MRFSCRTEEEDERLLAITERLGRKEDAEGLTPEENRLFDLLATPVLAVKNLR